MPGGTERPRNPNMELGQGKAKLDFTLALHQLVSKAFGNLFKESNLGLSLEQEAPGQLGVVQAYPAPLSPAPNPNSALPPTKGKKKKRKR